MVKKEYLKQRVSNIIPDNKDGIGGGSLIGFVIFMAGVWFLGFVKTEQLMFLITWAIIYFGFSVAVVLLLVALIALLIVINNRKRRK